MSGLASGLLDALEPLLPVGPLGRVAVGALGLVLLFAGRRLFWLVLGVIGFAAGFGLAWSWLPPLEEWQLIGLSILAGLVGALLVAAVQRVGVALAGAFVGGYAALWLSGLSLDRIEGSQWLLVIAAAVVGALLASLAFELALVVVSSLVGAELVVTALGASGASAAAIFVGLVLVGVLAQSFERRRARRRERRERRRDRRRKRDDGE